MEARVCRASDRAHVEDQTCDSEDHPDHPEKDQIRDPEEDRQDHLEEDQIRDPEENQTGDLETLPSTVAPAPPIRCPQTPANPPERGCGWSRPALPTPAP
jgi:hypothetical protein